MSSFIRSLPKEEQLTLKLSRICETYGYKRYRMAKFEEYTLYSDNRDFLPFEGIISFQNSSGQLMALKPDVTLSIIKNSKLGENGMTKLYYNEQVYRMNPRSGEVGELRQIGAELLGDADVYGTAEMLLMALKSLQEIDPEFVLSISHMQLITGLLEELSLKESQMKQILTYIREKNLHDLRSYGEALGLDEAKMNRLLVILNMTGTLKEAAAGLRRLELNEDMEKACCELEELGAILGDSPLSKHLIFDPTVINHMDYYVGVVFQGYVKKVPDMVLAGGRYDKLMHKVRRHMGAIGFAVYLDSLNLYYPNRPAVDTDILVIKESGCGDAQLMAVIEGWREEGYSVKVDTILPEHYRAGKIYRYENGNLQEVKTC